MAQKSRPTFKKRQREMARQQRQQDKMAQRLEKKSRPAGDDGSSGDEDPDIAGIRPGPQPLPQEWFGALPEVKPEESPE